MKSWLCINPPHHINAAMPLADTKLFLQIHIDSSTVCLHQSFSGCPVHNPTSFSNLLLQKGHSFFTEHANSYFKAGSGPRPHVTNIHLPWTIGAGENTQFLHTPPPKVSQIIKLWLSSERMVQWGAPALSHADLSHHIASSTKPISEEWFTE